MTDADIKTLCSRCLGTGLENAINPDPPVPCAGCGGSGYRVRDKIDVTAITDKLPSGVKLIYAYQIVEVLDSAEYTALGSAAKDGLRVILSCGVLDLIHTGKIYLALMAVFGSSPVTKAAIESL